MTEDKNLLAVSYDWWSHNGSIKPMQLKIALGSGKEPAMTIHPDGKITLGENAEPTEAAAACIEAMSDMIQSMIRKAAADERAAIVAMMWKDVQCDWMAEYHADILRDLMDRIQAGEHLK